MLHWSLKQVITHYRVLPGLAKTLGVVGVVGVLVADTSNSEKDKGAKFRRKPPFMFVCFRTKSDVHPVCTKSLSEKNVHNFEIFSKTYLTLFAQ